MQRVTIPYKGATLFECDLENTPPRRNDMGTHGNCVACRQYFGFFSFGLDSQTNRCGSCEPKLGTCKRCDQYFSGGVVDSETHRCPSCERTLRLIKKINEGELP